MNMGRSKVFPDVPVCDRPVTTWTLTGGLTESETPETTGVDTLPLLPGLSSPTRSGSPRGTGVGWGRVDHEPASRPVQGCMGSCKNCKNGGVQMSPPLPSEVSTVSGPSP